MAAWTASPRAAREHVLGNPADAYTGAGWALLIRCASCGRRKEMPVAGLARPDETMGALVKRLRCGRCHVPPSTVDLIHEGAARKRTEELRLIGPGAPGR
jgi:hypothetical protein